MNRRVLGPFARCVLFAALLLGVVLMHHVLTGHTEPGARAVAMAPGGGMPGHSGMPEHHGTGHDHDHTGLHLCLAVLFGALALAGLARSSRRLPAGGTGGTRARPGTPGRWRGRAPPLSGWQLLLRTCVSRR